MAMEALEVVDLVSGRRYVFSSSEDGVIVGTFDHVDADGQLHFADAVQLDPDTPQTEIVDVKSIVEIEPWDQTIGLPTFEALLAGRVSARAKKIRVGGCGRLF